MDAPRKQAAALALVLLALAPGAAAWESGVACLNGVDDDADGLVDCADPECLSDAVVEPLTLRLRRTRDTGDVLLSWEGGDPGVRHDVAAGPLDALGPAALRCVVDSVVGGLEQAGRTVGDPLPARGSAWYLVRAESPCTTGAFGADSFGEPRELEPGCRAGDEPASCSRGPVPGEVSAWVECDVTPLAELLVYLTNDSDEPVFWMNAACPASPDFDILERDGAWAPAVFCIVCGNGEAYWDLLPPGGEVARPPGTWQECLSPGTVRAWFEISEACPTGPSGELEPCGETRRVHSAAFVIE